MSHKQHNTIKRKPETQFLIDVIAAVMRACVEEVLVMLRGVNDGITHEKLDRMHRRYCELAAEINRSIDYLEAIRAEETKGCPCRGLCRIEYRKLMAVIRPPVWKSTTDPAPTYCSDICEKAPPILQDS